MENRILEVFYGTDGKPYKDQERSVLFPVVGNEYQGANDFTHIRFYYQRLCGENNTLVAVFKNAKGQLGCKPLSTATDSTRGEKYALLPISDFLTQYKGDIYIALQCYRGDADAITWDSDNNMWVINDEVPTIRSTANIKMSVNYAPMLVGGGEEETLTLQVLLSYIAEKSNIDDVVIVVGDISLEDLSDYDIGQLFYDNDTHTYYEKTNTSPYYAKALSGMGVLGAPNILCRSYDSTRTVAELHTIYGDSAYIVLRYLDKDYLYFSKKISSTYTCVAFDTDEQRFYKASGVSGSALPSTILIPANKIEIASKAFLSDNYVPYNGATRNVDLNRRYIYNASVDTEYTGENHNTFKNVDYKCISNIAFVLRQNTEIENNKISDDMYQYFLNENATLICRGLTYKKLTETPSDIIYACLNGSIAPITDGTSITLGRVISISKTEVDELHAYTESDLTIDLYSKDQAKAKFGTSLALELNNTNYKLVAKLYNANGGLIDTSNEIDFPLESIVSSATYYDEYTYDGTTYTKVIVITLSTTNVPTIVPVGDLISGLEKEACVEISTSSGTFTQEQMNILALDNAKIRFNGDYYHKHTNSTFVNTICSVVNVLGTTINVVYSGIFIYNTSTGEYSREENYINLYDKDQIDTKVGDLQNDVQDLDDKKANKDGRYESLTAGLANNFDTKQVMADGSAYNFRQTASMGSMQLEVGSPCKVKKIVGGSVAFNQLIQNGNFADNSYWSSDNGSVTVSDNVARVTCTADGTLSLKPSNFTIQTIANHKYLCVATVRISDNSKNVLMSTVYAGSEPRTNATDFTQISFVSYRSSDYVGAYPQLLLQNAVVGDWFEVKDFMLFELTQTLGSTIADYIYSLEQAEAGSGVAWFKRYFPKEYYAYNGGQLVSVKTQGKKITHFNQWDEEWELGNISSSTGEVTSGNYLVSKNFIKVISSSVYCFKHPTGVFTLLYFYDNDKNFIGEYDLISTHDPYNTFTIPQNVGYMKFVHYHSAYNHDICINFHYDGERDGEYEPYDSQTYPCDDEELRGFPQLDDDDNLVFDGDEYSYDGTKNVRYLLFKLDELNWVYHNEYQCFVATLTGKATAGGDAYVKTLISNGFDYSYNITDDKTYGYSAVSSNDSIYLRYDDANQDVTSLLSALSGVTLLVLAKTPTTDNLTPFTEVQECDNWGTEEWLAPTTDTRPCEVPVGHETDYLPDLKAKLEVAPATPSENGTYVMEHSASGNTYTLIGAWLSDNGYVKPTSISGYDNTKTQTLKNVEGTLTWVDDE